MIPIASELKTDIEKRLESLQTLRDEIRVRLHLAGMEAKDAWNKLEPTVLEAERLAEEISETSKAALDELVTRIKAFRASLPG